jgi:hypothetical protein
MLATRDDPSAAVVFAALALPKRESVRWGCVALRAIANHAGGLDERIREGLRLAEAWVRNPEEDERRAAGLFAESQYFEGAGAWIAFAAFTTSGSLASAGLQAVPPSPDISGKCVATAVMQAARHPDARQRADNLRAAVESAREFASGGDGTGPWRRRAGESGAKAAANVG